jgi:hypothetical protein
VDGLAKQVWKENALSCTIGHAKTFWDGLKRRHNRILANQEVFVFLVHE